MVENTLLRSDLAASLAGDVSASVIFAKWIHMEDTALRRAVRAGVISVVCNDWDDCGVVLELGGQGGEVRRGNFATAWQGG